MLKILNTLGRELQEFKPIEEGKVRFYQCGPTVYWIQHIGNMRAMTMSDLIRRSLSYMGYDVKFVRNYTDFGHLTGDNIGDADTGEDRMEKASKREGITPKEIADKYIQVFEEDVALLNIMKPTVTARATDYLDSMIKMVQKLLDKGFAYLTPEAIYFDITKFPEYTKLSGQKLEMNKVGEGHGEVTLTSKRNPQDFAVWFFRVGPHANALQYWESPFESPLIEKGYGFPGWHIECSAMVKDNLGDTIDIHMGGVEHISIHHTNEIAQSESANDKKYVNYWIHNEHLDIDGGKMSKSLGNVYSLNNIIEKGYDPMHLRYFFLQSHYRSKQNFTFEALDASKTAYVRLVNLLKAWAMEARNEAGDKKQEEIDVRNQKSDDSKTTTPLEALSFKEKFISALEEDFNIPQALALVWEVSKSDLNFSQKLNLILDFDRVLGLKLEEKLDDPTQIEISLEAQIMIEERELARLQKEWKKADELRDKLKVQFGLEVKDTANGQVITKS
jgi:cysteinyl-tRNA synthetase